MKRMIWMMSFIVYTGFSIFDPIIVNAARGVCDNHPMEPMYDNPPGNIDYKVSVDSFHDCFDLDTDTDDQQDPFSDDQILQAVILAADTWNEQSNASFLTYIGTAVNVTEQDEGFEKSLPDCTNTYDALVKGNAMQSGSCDYAGNCGAYCYDPINGPNGPEHYSFVVSMGWGDETYFINPEDLNSARCLDRNGDGKPECADFVKGVIHEFGHALEDSDDTADNGSIMEQKYYGGGTRGRDLFNWDLQCAYDNLYDPKIRNETIARVRISGSTFTQDVYDMIGEGAKVSAGAYYNTNGNWLGFSYIRRKINDNYGWKWFKEEDPNYSVELPIPRRVGIGPRDVVFKESPKMHQIFYSALEDVDKNDPANLYSKKGSHPLEYYRFDSTLATPTVQHGTMKRCDTMKIVKNAADIKCNYSGGIYQASTVYTSKPISAAWDNASQKTIIAWVNQARDNETIGGNSAPDQNHDIMISVGYQMYDILYKPDNVRILTGTNVKSSVGVGLACNDDTAGYNCILAYVDETAPPADSGKIKIKKFKTVWSDGEDKYKISFDSNTYKISAKTGSSIAAWYNSTSKLFYFAIRSATENQPLRIYKSTGVGFSEVTGLPELLNPINGPSAVSYYTGEANRLYYPTWQTIII